ncbi:MAG: multifunctional CCA tRNA nucleotidyl transferase/2'3'-cyclic phosphodiesterase/2'nucleotidase/phosphatase, partial [Betaproteobacteria bacterium]|nr:multifunctional CCA tRNA nucleotidyl transferase/2'3'-cyclic phosphodiesterase/2'nucleotidase/phosphatase [Betaproteobacteria bacterium]
RFGFNIAPETLSLMRAMVANGEVDALVPERVWQELARGLMEKVPSRFFFTLRDCGALVKILPEVDALFGVPQPPKHHPEIDCGIHTMLVLDDAAQHDYPLEVRFSALTHERSVDLLRALCARLRVTNDCRDLGLLVARYHGNVHRAPELRPDTIVAILQNCDAWRRPERFTHLLQACASDARGRTGHEQDAYPQADYLLRMLRATQTVNAGEIAQQCEDKNAIADKVREARIMAVERAIKG